MNLIFYSSVQVLKCGTYLLFVDFLHATAIASDPVCVVDILST